MGLVKGMILLLVTLQMLVVIVVKGSGLPRRLVQVQLLMSIPDPDPGTQRRGDGKDCAPPSSEGEGGEVGVPRNLFLRLGLGDDFLAPGDAWNLPSEGTGVGVFAGWTVQPKGPVHWN